jgi:tripartite motif-containing protein 71
LGTGEGELLLGEGASQQAAFEASRMNPEAIAAREMSETRFEGEGSVQAAATLKEAFPEVVSQQDGGPPPLVAGEKSLGFESANLEQVETGSGEVGVVQSLTPMAVASGGDRWAAVDLAPREVAGGFEAQNPLVPVRLPKHLAEGAQSLIAGVSLTPVDEHGTPLGGAEGVVDGAGVFYANTQTDTDTVLKLSSLGLDASAVLRSVDSPEVLYYRIGMPAGARLVAESDGVGAEVIDEGVAIARIRPPTAKDSTGAEVPTSMTVSGDTLTVRVRHSEGSYMYPILVDPELSGYWQDWSNVVAGDWEFHEFSGYAHEIAGAELRMQHGRSFPAEDYAIWSEKTQGYTKIFDVYVKDELYPWVPVEGKRDTPHWLKAFIEIYKSGGGTENFLELSGSPYRSEGTVCGTSGCSSAEGDAEGNNFSFALTTTEAGLAAEEFYAHAEQVSTGIAQAQGKHSTVAYNTGSSEIEGSPNVLVGSGAWIGPRSGKLEFASEDGGLGVAESWAEVDGSGGWEKRQDTNFMSSGSCKGIQCAAHEHEVLSYESLTDNGTKPLPEPEARIRVAAKSPMPYSSSSEHGEGETTLKVDAKKPHGITVSGLPAKGSEGKELTLGEGPATIVAEAVDGEGTTPSSGLKAIRLYIDGAEIGHGGGACAPGPCVGAAQWALKGAELGAGAHPMTVQAEGNTGERENAEYTLNVYAAAPVTAGPGSVNPESGDFALEASDVPMSGGMGSLALLRHYDSRDPQEGSEGPFGAPWRASLGSLASLEVLPEGSVMVVGPTGLSYFKAKGGGSFEAPQGDKNLELRYEPSYEGEPAYLFKNAKEDTTTVFTLPEHASSWMPTVSKGPTATNTTADEYRTVEVSGGKWVVEPTLELAPHPNVECAKEHWHAGCRALEFVYDETTTAEGESESEWGGYKNRLKEVIAVAYNPATKAITKTPAAAYRYDRLGRLRQEWNPSIKPALKTDYGYDSENHVTALTPPGQQPWLMHYGTTAQDTSPGRLLSVGRLSAKTPLWNGARLTNTGHPELSTLTPEIGRSESVVENGHWSTSAVLYEYQWEDCNAALNSEYYEKGECLTIPGAVNASYTPQPRDAGYKLVVLVTAEGSWGAATTDMWGESVVPMPAPTYSSAFGATGSESEKLKQPAGVAVDSEGNVWVADVDGNRVEKFSASGTFLHSYSPDSMLEPVGIAVSPTSGDIYVVNRGRDRIDELKPSGELIAAFGGEGAGLGKLSYPSQLTVNAHGEVWVADTGNKRVDEFSASGTYLGSAWGGGGGTAALQAPVGIAECAGTLYVADETGNDVQVLSGAGEYKFRFGHEKLSKPQQVACEPGGAGVYVVDAGNGTVEEFDAEGGFLEKFGSPGLGEGDLFLPVGIAAVGVGGTIYVADNGNNRISVWKASYSTNNPIPTPPPLTENPVSTIEYNIPLSGTGLPNMTSAELAKWGQKDDPAEGAAIFPPDEPMGWPAVNYKRATISYQDEQMRTVNVASPSGATPTEAISTTEYNSENEVIRTLSAENRAAALKEANPLAASELLDTKSAYKEGELTDTWGPQHSVKLAQGKSETDEPALARNHVKYFYDEGAPDGESYELVTKVVDGAETPSKEEFDIRTAKTSYSGQHGLGWKLRQPTSTTTDPSGLDLTHSVEYNETTGAVIEAKNPGATSELVYPPVYSGSFGSEGASKGQLAQPTGIAVDAEGNTWVADDANNRVQKFSPTGTALAVYGSKGTGVDDFEAPSAIAINATTGNVYVADMGNKRIDELSSSGAFVQAFGWGVRTGAAELQTCTTSCKAGISGASKEGQFDEPAGIAVGEEGDVWVVDHGNDRVEEYSSEGKFLSEFADAGSGAGQLNEPRGIVVDEGELYVADYGNNRVEEFSPSGQYLAQIGSKGNKEGQLEGPFGVAVNSSTGYLFVSDSKNERVQEFTPAGKFLAEFGSSGTGQGQLRTPAGLALNATGDIYVADELNDRIDEWHPPQPGGAHLLYSTQFGSAGSGHGQFSSPAGVAIDGHGNVWVVDRGNDRVEEFTAAGQFMAAYGSEGSGELQFKEPTGITIDQSDNDVYVSDCGNNRIVELSSNGTFLRSFGSYGSEPGELDCPGGLAISAAGDIWVADTKNNRIEDFTNKGKLITGFKNTRSEELFNEPLALVLSGDNIYVTDAKSNEIEELSTTGTTIRRFGTLGGASGQLHSPSAITLDSAGNLYVLDSDNNRTEEFTPTGEFISSYGSAGSGEGQLDSPQGLALDPAGDLYVADTGNDRIQKWSNANQAVHETKTIYYTAGTEAAVEACQNHQEWVNLPCQTEPAAQPEEGMPQLPVTDIKYNTWDQPETTIETFGKTERKTVTSFDEAGRPLTTEETSTNDQPLPEVSETYNETNGSQETLSTGTGKSAETITSVTNTLGQLERYTDAEGNTAEYKRDIDGRVIEVTDGSEEAKKKYGYEGSQKYHYDETTGELTRLEDSAAGTFTASYTIGGRLSRETYPNGMSAYYTINPAGQDTALEYKKETHCTEHCTWFSDRIEPSIHGETITQASSLSEENYSYATAGWLDEVQETPTDEGCKTRIYGHEEEGDRTSLTTREPAEGKCASEGGIIERHTYDAANQLTDPGVTYEAFGNTTELPANDAGGSALASKFYLDGQVYKQTQNETTIEYKTDPESRTRETITSGGAETTHAIAHYDGPGSALAWTVEPSTGKWTRDIPGIDGTLAATQTNTTAPVLLLHDLQGDVVAEAGISETETKLLKTYNSTEYGVPTTKTPPRYGWLGAEGLASELPSGTITQDGATYVPQTGRPLQAETPTLPLPTKYYEAFETPNAEGATWGPIAAALRVAESKQAEHARELAQDPPGEVPETIGEYDPQCRLTVEVTGNGRGYVSAIGIASCGRELLPKYSEIQACLLIEPEDAELYDGGILKACKEEGSGYNPENRSEEVGLKGSSIASVTTQCTGETAYYAWAWFWIAGGHRHNGTSEWSKTKWRCGESKIDLVDEWAETINGLIPPVAVPGAV